MRARVFGVSALVGAIALGGLPAFAQEPPAATPTPLIPHPGERIPAYDAAGRRDPFRPFALAQEQAKAVAGSPLQQYQVGQLKLVGVMDDGQPSAIVEDDQGNGYVLRQGPPVGPNGGMVVSIRGRQVTVVEWETDIVGERHRKEYVLQMPSDEPSKPRPRG